MKYHKGKSVELNDYFLNEKRFTSDSIVNKIADKIFLEEHPQEVLELVASITRNSDLLPEKLPSYLKEYFSSEITVSDWVSKNQLKISSDFFQENAQHILLCLVMLSLPYCYAAGVDAEVLLLSQRIKNDTKKRLSETAQFVFDVMAHDAFESTGYGIRSIQKVRLMHAIVRHHLKKRHMWDISKGLPINQEAMAGTNLSFSLLILRGLQKLYITITPDIEQAYILRWNAIGSMLGIDDDLLFDDINKTIQLEQKIKRRHFQKTSSGLELTSALINTIQVLVPDKSLDKFVYPLMSYLLGNDISAMLEIPCENAGSSDVITLLKMKNSLEQALNIKSGKVTFAMNKQLIGEESNQRTNFQSPFEI